MYGPFPREVLYRIKQYPGNNKCCDCSSSDTDWGNINHGTLHCLSCAGKHRRFGVQISFIRSIYMDSWSPLQVYIVYILTHGFILSFLFLKFRLK